jgi:hypothetical protein
MDAAGSDRRAAPRHRGPRGRLAPPSGHRRGSFTPHTPERRDDRRGAITEPSGRNPTPSLTTAAVRSGGPAAAARGVARARRHSAMAPRRKDHAAAAPANSLALPCGCSGNGRSARAPSPYGGRARGTAHGATHSPSGCRGVRCPRCASRSAPRHAVIER